MPGLTCGVSMSSTSEPRRPAMRMPSMSEADLRVIVMVRQLSQRRLKCGILLSSIPRDGCSYARIDAAPPHEAAPRIQSLPPASPHRMSPTQKHLLHFEGGNALSAFRAQALLPKLQSVSSRITGVAARHVHWVWTDEGVQPDATRELATLLRYGDAAEGPPAEAADSALVVVMPRLGTVSPWASKATDIAHNCGIDLHRVERVTEFRLGAKGGLFGGAKPLSAAERTAVAAALHDRMTESVAFERDAAAHLFDARPAPPLAHVDVLE